MLRIYNTNLQFINQFNVNKLKPKFNLKSSRNEKGTQVTYKYFKIVQKK